MRSNSGCRSSRDLLRGWAQLCRARHRDGEETRRGAEHPAQRRYRVSRQQRADRTRREHRDPEGCRRACAIRGGAGGGHRQAGETPVRERRTVRRTRLTIGNDMSERTWQRGDRTLWRAKNTDTFKPMGPWIETDFDLDAAETTVRVNGDVTDHFRTNHMIHGVAKFLARMSRYLTLYPGDVVWMGTEGAPRNLKHGDVCEIEITGIGTLRNPLVREGMS